MDGYLRQNTLFMILSWHEMLKEADAQLNCTMQMEMFPSL